MPHSESFSPKTYQEGEVVKALSKHRGLSDTLIAWAAFDYHEREMARKHSLPYEQVLDIAVADPEALAAIRYFLETSGRATGRDSEEARSYLNELAWGVMDRLLKGRVRWL